MNLQSLFGFHRRRPRFPLAARPAGGARAGELAEWIPSERLITDPAELRVYECDGLSLVKHSPVAVALCLGREEVQRTVEWCHSTGTPFVPRGAGTGRKGGATPAPGSVVIDTTLMRRVLRVDSENYYAVVEPGLVNLDLTRSVEPGGLCFSPDPPSRTACTLAGSVAENSSGPHGFKYGVTTDHILGLEVVLPDGNVVRLGGPQAEAPSYDLTGLFVGTEGTMGVITEITVRLLPRPQAARTCLAAFAEPAQACRAALDITRHGIIPAALEILDRNAIEALEASAHAAGTPPHAAAVLLVEIDGVVTALEEEEVRIRRVVEANQALEVRRARDPSESERLWDGHRRVFGAMGKIRTDLYVVEGVVPRSRMEAVLGRIHEIAAKHDILLSNVIHAGDGSLHSCIAHDGRDPGETKRALAAGREILEACFRAAGSISGDREVATEEMALMPRVLDEPDLELQAAIRRTVDPREISNRGKAFPGSRPSVKARDALEERSLP